MSVGSLGYEEEFMAFCILVLDYDINNLFWPGYFYGCGRKSFGQRGWVILARRSILASMRRQRRQRRRRRRRRRRQETQEMEDREGREGREYREGREGIENRKMGVEMD